MTKPPKISDKKDRKVKFFELFSIVLRLCYDVVMYVQEVTVLRTGLGQRNVSAGQWGTGEEGQQGFGMIRSNLAKC